MIGRLGGLLRGLAAVVVVGITCVMGTLNVLFTRDRSERSAAIKRWGGRNVLGVSGVRVTVEGVEHVPREGGYVLISNHESHLDGPLLVGWFPRTFTIVAKRELFRIPIMGMGFRAFGFVEVDRGDHSQAVGSMDAATTHLRGGGGVLVFPEGHRAKSPALQPFKKGGFVQALKAGVPVIPAGIAGTREVLPSGRTDIRPGAVHLCIGPPISVQGMTVEDRDILTAEAERIVAALREAARAALPPETRAQR